MFFETPPDRRTSSEQQTSAAISLILNNLETSGFEPGFSGEVAETHKAKLERVARRLPEIGSLLLATFRELGDEQRLDPGKLALFAIGGRVRGTPIKEGTDFDLVIAAEHELTPFGKSPNITIAQRHTIARALNIRIEQIFIDLGIQEDYEPGIIELKGFGERTSKTVENEHDTLKLVENLG